MLPSNEPDDQYNVKYKDGKCADVFLMTSLMRPKKLGIFISPPSP
jgi:hypothetical protein